MSTKQEVTDDLLHSHSSLQSHSRSKLSQLDSPEDVTVQNAEETKEANDKLQKMEEAFKTILRCVGEEPGRQGLLKTPSRAAKAFMYFTKGYEESVNSKLVSRVTCFIVVDSSYI